MCCDFRFCDTIGLFVIRLTVSDIFLYLFKKNHKVFFTVLMVYFCYCCRYELRIDAMIFKEEFSANRDSLRPQINVLKKTIEGMAF